MVFKIPNNSLREECSKRSEKVKVVGNLGHEQWFLPSSLSLAADQCGSSAANDE